MNILLILLGCNISYLLNNRIDTAIQFVSKLNNTNVNWFLSGGVKNPSNDIVTEAEKMEQQIKIFMKSNVDYLIDTKWNYFYDVKSTNTAENFIMASNFINETNVPYDDVYVITSKFHQNRASKIAEQILDIKLKWILGDAELPDSNYWENIHMKNVNDDVKKALNQNPLLK
jgi:hypothetical protein